MEKKKQAAAEPGAGEENAIEIEPTVETAAPGAGEKPVGGDELHLQLEDARNKADEHWNQLMRARAEMENLRKRHAREVENAHKFGLERFLSELLAVRDSLELGVNAAQDEGADVAKLREGGELTLKLLSDVMERFNVVQINPEGEPFNPEFHQAMAMEAREGVPPNTVVTVVQRGYTLNGRLLRPALVIVSQDGAPPKVDEQA